MYSYTRLRSTVYTSGIPHGLTTGRIFMNEPTSFRAKAAWRYRAEKCTDVDIAFPDFCHVGLLFSESKVLNTMDI